MDDTNNNSLFTFVKPQEHAICFSNNERELGCLILEKDKLTFSGDADESAKIFFGILEKMYSEKFGNKG